MERDNKRLLQGKRVDPVPTARPKEERTSKFKRQLNEDIFGADDVVTAPKRSKEPVIEEIETPGVQESSRN